MSEELKPCPFCGQYPSEGHGETGHTIECTNIHCYVAPSMFLEREDHIEDTRYKAIAIWNKRKRAPAPECASLSEVLCLYQDVANAAERLHVAINLAEENYDAWHGKKGVPPSHEVQQKLSAECVAAEEGLTAALAKLRAGPRTTSAPAPAFIELDTYDAGLLNDYGGGNVEWWQDYIRAELGRAHEFYQNQIRAPARVTVSRDAVEAACDLFVAAMAEAHGEVAPEKDPEDEGWPIYRQIMRRVLEAYESAHGESDGWVACSERMPEDSEDVFIWPQQAVASHVYMGRGRYEWRPNVDAISGHDWEATSWKTEEVTHWRPLPPPPTDKAREVNDGK